MMKKILMVDYEDVVDVEISMEFDENNDWIEVLNDLRCLVD